MKRQTVKIITIFFFSTLLLSCLHEPKEDETTIKLNSAEINFGRYAIKKIPDYNKTILASGYHENTFTAFVQLFGKYNYEMRSNIIRSDNGLDWNITQIPLDWNLISDFIIEQDDVVAIGSGKVLRIGRELNTELLLHINREDDISVSNIHKTDNTFIIYGGRGGLYTSNDLFEWNNFSLIEYGSLYDGVTANGLTILIGDWSLLTSYDLVNWQHYDLGDLNLPRGQRKIIFAFDSFYLIDFDKYHFSLDGEAWETNRLSNTVIGTAFFNNKLFFLLDNNTLLSSANGKTFELENSIELSDSEGIDCRKYQCSTIGNYIIGFNE